MDDMFSENYIPNLQTSFKSTKKIRNESVEIEIVDMEGQNEYTQIVNPKIFQIGIDGYILCYSIENQHSFKLITTINNKLSDLLGREMPKVLVANKSDLTTTKRYE